MECVNRMLTTQRPTAADTLSFRRHPFPDLLTLELEVEIVVEKVHRQMGQHHTHHRDNAQPDGEMVAPDCHEYGYHGGQGTLRKCICPRISYPIEYLLHIVWNLRMHEFIIQKNHLLMTDGHAFVLRTRIELVLQD